MLLSNADTMKHNLSINLRDDCHEIRGLFCMDGLTRSLNSVQASRVDSDGCVGLVFNMAREAQ